MTTTIWFDSSFHSSSKKKRIGNVLHESQCVEETNLEKLDLPFLAGAVAKMESHSMGGGGSHCTSFCRVTCCVCVEMHTCWRNR